MRKAVIWLLLAPFLALALLPQSAMFADSPAGLTLVICTGDEFVEITVDPETGEPVEAGSGAAPCDWASLHLPALAGIQSLTTLALPAAPARLAPPASLTLRFAQATGLPPSTGPPAVF